MIKRSISNIEEAERLICMNIKSFIADLCLTDKSFLIEHIINANHNVINDIVKSSSEMFFKPGTLCYDYNARISERYNAVPSICIDMRFAHKLVMVNFFLHIEDDFAGVSLTKETLKRNRRMIALSQLSDAFYDARIYDHTQYSPQQDNSGSRPFLLN